MKEVYLWDRTGEPDPQTAHLEQLMSRFQFSGTQPPAHFYSSVKRRTPARRPRLLAIAALVLAGIAVPSWYALMRVSHPATSWQLSVAGGASKALRAGEIIETSKTTGATLESAYIGQVRIEPESRLRVSTSLTPGNGGEQRLALDHGTIHALIWAPPQRFVVETASAKTVDLGCAYTLHVTKNGTGTLTVETGWVAFQWRDLESFIPAGAACMTRPGRGPGLPHFTDASASLESAIVRFDTQRDPSALDDLLRSSRKRDALTLWHLLARTRDAERGRVFDRLAYLIDLPQAATRDAVVRGDASAIDAVWDAMDLGDTSWWREWKRRW